MKSYLIPIFFCLIFKSAFAQSSNNFKLTGWWVNTQYSYYSSMPQYKDILYKISPWFVKIDSSGRCSVILIHEQKAELGYPIKKEIRNGNPMYHYKKKIGTWIYGVEGNNSLMVYSNGTTPGAGTIFKRYKPN